MGSEKDIEDAAHLYEVFKQWLDVGLAEDFARRLGVEKTDEEDHKMKDDLPEIDLKELKKWKKKNARERMEWVKRYAEWLKKTPNKEWSHQQKKLID